MSKRQKLKQMLSEQIKKVNHQLATTRYVDPDEDDYELDALEEQALCPICGLPDYLCNNHD